MRNLLRLNSNQREYAAAGPSATYSLTSPPLPLPLALMFCSSRTVNKNRLHVKLCLASVKRSSTIDSNSPEHDVASVPPATTSLLPLPHPRSLYPAGAAILHALWLHLLAGFVCASVFFLFGLLSFYFLALLLLFFYFLHIFLAFMFFGRCCLVVRPALNK